MTQVEYETAMFEAQIESQKTHNEKVKVEIKLLEVDIQLKQAQLNKFLAGSN